MANTTIQIGTIILPATQHYNYVQMPQYAEFVSMNGIIWRDRPTVEKIYRFTLGWECLSPAEKLLADAAWNAILEAKPAPFVRYVGITSTPYTILPDSKSNDYNFTLYSGVVGNSGFTTLADVTLTFLAQRIAV